ncbi:MAG: hypothetical protein ABJB66_00950 [Gemmatimonadaceae bacterium]
MNSRNSIPLLLCGAIAVSALAVHAPVAYAQAAVPIRELATVDAKTTQAFGNIFNVRQLSGGRVLVNDGTRRQLVVLDGALSNPTVLIDSATIGGQSYGPRAAPLIPYLADSTLFVDGQSLSLLVIDPSGKIAHVMSAPKSSDLNSLAGSNSGVDARGNLIYRAGINIQRMMSGPPTPGKPPVIQIPDSQEIVRASFETRAVDTLGRVKIASNSRTSTTVGEDGKMKAVRTVNPLVTVDEWAVLSDGTVAFIRGHDYHVDFVHPDGKMTSTAKLPFDWKRLTDADKQGLIDSARTAMDKAAADAKEAAKNPGAAKSSDVGGGAGGEMKVVTMTMSAAGGSGGGSFGGGGAAMGGGMPMNMNNFTMPTATLEFVPLKDIADYYPAIRQGAAKADLDGNLWILPTTSAQSKAGELIYDVVNNRGELFQRVRLPVGRSIAGFGHNGIVYLMYREPKDGWFLERTKILNNTRATDDLN